MLLKVCGVCGDGAEGDLDLLADAHVDLVGLWHGVPGGHADLSTGDFTRLAVHAREAGVEPVLVTFESKPSVLAEVIRRSGVRWVQLHAYQLPNAVQQLRAAFRRPRLTLVKVLHVRRGHCIDLRLVRAYERAGVDAFLLDATSQDGRVGSTGESIPPEVASSLAAELERPFFLAGGISAASRWTYKDLATHEGFVGIDVSTGARDDAGRLRRRSIETINRAWRGQGRSYVFVQ